MNTQQARTPDVLSTSQSWALLRETVVGRLAVVVGDQPEIFPVNYLVDHGSIVFRTAEGTKLAASIGRPVAFEVDAIDASWEEGWSVVVHGHAELLDSEDVISKLGDLLVRPWVPAERASHIRIVPERITGRSIEAGRHRRTDVPSWDLRAMPPRD